jgi:hypothetical protein
MDLVPPKTKEHKANHRQIDHGFAGLGLTFVIPSEAAGAGQPSKGALHDPTTRQDLEGVKLGALHDFDGATPESARFFQQRGRAPSVGADMFDGAACGSATKGGVIRVRPEWPLVKPQFLLTQPLAAGRSRDVFQRVLGGHSLQFHEDLPDLSLIANGLLEPVELLRA